MEIKTNNLRLLVMDNFEEFGRKVDGHLKLMRGIADPTATFIVPTRLTRFASGEGKGEILESIRGKETYILTDVMNHSCTYEMHGYLNHKSPDDHYQDLKRVISAMDGAEEKLTVIMPFIYEGRQHKRKGRESKDCSLMLQELESLGVTSFITFDAHDPSIRNSLHRCSFDSIYPTYNILKEFIENEPIETSVDIKVDAFIPSSYITDEIQKIEVYKKIAAIENINDFMEIKSELEDRYSSIPDSVYNLMDIAYIKSICKGLYIEDIKETAKELRFKFVKGYKGFEGIYSVLLKQYKDDVILYFGETPSFAIKLDNIKKETALEYYKKLLEDIS